jgi:dTDP-L-rhamnose 4-epimerase
MHEKILITGGAGFIGTNLIMALPKSRWEIVILDALIEQVHRGGKWTPPSGVTFFHGDIRDRGKVRVALEGADYVVHLAAETGVGQSAYEIARYVSVNEFGTAVLLEEASKMRDGLEGIILASSRAVYGEGRYICEKCGEVYPGERIQEDLQQCRWDPDCPGCGRAVRPVGSKEDQPLRPSSIYGITKHNQEQLLAQFTKSFNIPSVALRLQNVYGPGQSLRNPYTGILSIFGTRIMSGNPVLIYEDGKEKRDFIFVDDVVESISVFLEKGFSGHEVYNVGTGEGTTVLDVAQVLVNEMGGKAPPVVAGKYRVGDIRHAWADISKIKESVGFGPSIMVPEGLRRFAGWVKEQPAQEDRYESMEREMAEKGLLGKGGQ